MFSLCFRRNIPLTIRRHQDCTTYWSWTSGSLGEFFVCVYVHFSKFRCCIMRFLSDVSPCRFFGRFFPFAARAWCTKVDYSLRDLRTDSLRSKRCPFHPLHAAFSRPPRAAFHPMFVSVRVCDAIESCAKSVAEAGECCGYGVRVLWVWASYSVGVGLRSVGRGQLTRATFLWGCISMAMTAFSHMQIESSKVHDRGSEVGHVMEWTRGSRCCSLDFLPCPCRLVAL